MKSALIISLVLHIAVGVVWFRLVKISQVRFVPRQVYTVSLVTPAQARKPVDEQVTTEPEEPVPPKPDVREERAEDVVPPEQPKKPEPKEKPKQVKKTMPTEQKKTVPDAPQQVQPDEKDAGDDVVTGDISVDGEDFPFAYYLTTIKRKVAANWRVPGTSSGEPTYCRVYFRISRDGSIVSPTIEKTSGSFMFDQAALRAVVQANPLPPLPGGFSDDYLGVHFSFAYEEE